MCGATFDLTGPVTSEPSDFEGEPVGWLQFGMGAEKWFDPLLSLREALSISTHPRRADTKSKFLSRYAFGVRPCKDHLGGADCH